MKKIAIILSVCAVIIGNFSCIEPDPIPISFKDVEKLTIYDYILENQDEFSSFLSILEKGGLDKTLSAYNPNGDGYTLFLPNNGAINDFIEQSDQYSSLDDLLNDAEYVNAFSRYHVVNAAIDANDFPFGALPELTLTEDYLTVGFIIETDTSYYKINNQAPVVRTNIELSNGFIHLISAVLTPITLTTYNWLEQHEGFSIFKEAADATGLNELLDFNAKLVEEAMPFTLFVEPDSIFNKKGINSFEDLANLISPGKTDYTNTLNPLYNFVAYHIMTNDMFLDEFANMSTNYSTYSDIPFSIDGTGIDIKINKWKEVFDTIVYQTDTTFIDYVGIFYDASNVLTQSGVIHLIDQVLKQQTPTRAIQTYEFRDEPLFNEFRDKAGTYLIEDSSLLTVVNFSGTDLFYVKMEEEPGVSLPWSADYIMLDGDFSISYTIPKLVQGNYTVLLQADTYNSSNAVVEVFIDGKPIGGSIDLANIGSPSANAPFVAIELGTMNFLKYQAHTITVRSLIPGAFSWDYIRFEPL